MKLLPAFLFTILLFPNAKTWSQKRNAKFDTTVVFDKYIQQAIKDWQVPALAIVVVKDNQTLFICASTTKAMTATCMAMLVDQGKLNWDDLVIKYLPDFKLFDPFVTRDIRIRDLFLHNSGVGNADYLWVNSQLNAAQIVDKLQLIKPSYPYRAGFIYQNIFYLVAGQVIEKIAGMPWSEFITKNIFLPLGMNRTKALLSMVTDDNIASPHFIIDSVLQPIEQESVDAMGPAGSVLSSIDDISLWLSCMLDSSKYAGGRLVKPATWNEMLKPQTLVPESQFYPTQSLTKPNFTSYALGWFQQDYRGFKLNFHTGSLSGAVAIHG